MDVLLHGIKERQRMWQKIKKYHCQLQTGIIILMQKVEAAIKRLKSNESAETDNVTVDIITYGHEKLNKEINGLYNKQCNTFGKKKNARKMEKSIIMLIHKKGVHQSAKSTELVSH